MEDIIEDFLCNRQQHQTEKGVKNEKLALNF